MESATGYRDDMGRKRFLKTLGEAGSSLVWKVLRRG